jgi:hypothetical protein
VFCSGLLMAALIEASMSALPAPLSPPARMAIATVSHDERSKNVISCIGLAGGRRFQATPAGRPGIHPSNAADKATRAEAMVGDQTEL